MGWSDRWPDKLDVTKRADFKSVKSSFQNASPNQVLNLIFEWQIISGWNSLIMIDTCFMIPCTYFCICLVLISCIFVEQREVCRLFAGPENHDGVPACTFPSFYNIYFLFFVTWAGEALIVVITDDCNFFGLKMSVCF